MYNISTNSYYECRKRSLKRRLYIFFNYLKYYIKLSSKKILNPGLLFLAITAFLLIGVGFFVQILFYQTDKARAQSNLSDAIAIRVLPNSEHRSVLHWYREQEFKGSPQSIEVDGYRGIRDGRTVYVNAANIDDNNTADISDDALHTNIYLISYNQTAEKNTQDIYARILSRWKFTIDITNYGTCKKDTNINCRIDSDCPAEDYCQSEQARIRRDVLRMEDIAEIRDSLAAYKEGKGEYPRLDAGTYLPHRTLSTWPSWQKLLSQYLKLNLPVDPINELGDCGDSRFHPDTCWDEVEKEFAWSLPDGLPAGNFAYVYYATSSFEYILCAQMETDYTTIDQYNCVSGALINNPPQITGANLVGWPRQPFVGYAGAIDPDGDNLTWTVTLFTPNVVAGWENQAWIWYPGNSGFREVLDNITEVQEIELYAQEGGYASIPGMYQILLSVNDGRGELNSIATQTFDVTVNSHQMFLSDAEDIIVIGQPRAFTLAGTDNSLNAITELHFDSASLDSPSLNGTVSINEGELINYGFSINGMDLNENYVNSQRTGNYIINVYGLDPTTSVRVDSSLSFEIINNPPIISNVDVTFENANTQNCTVGENCVFSIDNQELARVQINAADSDIGHVVSYDIPNNPGPLNISPAGEITGFDNLNSLSAQENTYNFTVVASDQYCAQSSPNECSDQQDFTVTVMPYCSAFDAASARLYYSPGVEFPITSSGENIPFYNSLEDCREVGDSSMDIEFRGIARSQAIIFVLDLSSSMEILVDGTPAINQMKENFTETNGILEQLYDISQGVPASIRVRVGLVGYNDSTPDFYPSSGLADLGAVGTAGLISTISAYVTDFQTNTLEALNQAERMLDPIGDDHDKIVILMSDGIPGIDCEGISRSCDENSCGCGRICSQDSLNWPECAPNGQEHAICCNGDNYTFGHCCLQGETWCNRLDICCLGNRGDANYLACCPLNPTCDPQCGSPDTGCYDCPIDPPTCETPTPCGDPPTCTPYVPCQCGPDDACNFLDCLDCGSNYNTESDFKIAITQQTRCISTDPDPPFLDCYLLPCDNPGPCANLTGCHYDTYSYVCSGEQRPGTSLFLNCDLSIDVNAQATHMKTNENIVIYSIYYDTTGDPAPFDRMCDWSSANGGLCPGPYAYSGSDIDDLLSLVITQLLNKPDTASINGLISISDPDDTIVVSTASNINFDNLLSCGLNNFDLTINYTGGGTLSVLNPSFYYCPPFLHP